MIRRVSWGAVLTLVALVSPSVAAAGTLDQQQPTANATDYNETVIGDQRQAAQTFTAGLTGGLDQVDVYVGGRPLPCESGSGIHVQIQTSAGEGAPSGTSLASATIPPTSIPGAPSWASVAFVTPAPVTAGSRYALVLSAPDATCPLDPGEGPFLWTGNTSETNNPYPAGSAWLKDPGLGPDWVPNDIHFDEAFKTYVVPQLPPTDTDAPEVTITKGAPKRTEKSKVKFKFESNEPNASFECKKDRKPWRPCTSPTKMKRLDEGKHKFKVRATDQAGNTGAPETDKFRVVR